MIPRAQGERLTGSLRLPVRKSRLARRLALPGSSKAADDPGRARLRPSRYGNGSPSRMPPGLLPFGVPTRPGGGYDGSTSVAEQRGVTPPRKDSVSPASPAPAPFAAAMSTSRAQPPILGRL